MSPGKPFVYKNILLLISAGWLILSTSSCYTVIKNYPANKPFVYKTNVDLTGNFSKNEKDALESRLYDQVDDSMKSRSVSKVLWSVMKSPPVFDSANADKSILSMKALLRSLGYFSDSTSYTDTVIIEKDQHRTIVNFNVEPRKQVTLDSIGYVLQDSALQAITDAHKDKAFIKKGDPFAKNLISVELDRLVDLYRNNGYLRFTKDELKAYWDTLNLALLNPSLDPFEQISLLDSLRKGRINPKANLEIKLRPGFDSDKLVRYYIGDVYVYPDYNQDTINHAPKETIVNGVRVIYYRRIFKPRILPPNIYFHHGELYNQTNYLKTITRFGALNAWNVVNIDTIRQANEDTMDFHIHLSPAKKYSFVTNFEGSRNQSAISGNLFGLAVNFGLQNRNFAKAANQANTNVRYGIEFGNNKGEQFIQTQQIVLSHNIYFPRALLLSGKLKEKANSVLSFNAASTDRRELYQLTSFNSAFGWDIQVKKGILSIRYPNIEFSNLNPRPTLDSIFLKNPSLRNIFTDGFVESILGGLTLTGGKKKNIHIFRFNGELSGVVTSLINKSRFLDTNLYRFIKVDGEYTNKIQLSKSAIAWRLFGGIGYEFNSTVNPLKKNNLPFFKQYFSGGPNSMRAWGLRRLGPGSAIKNFTDTNAIPERYGDVQLELNVEWRFPLANISGVLVNGAFFTDIGNIWLRKKNAGPPEEVFSLTNLIKDYAVGVGAGLRIDFNFFVLRFDYAYKVKDPSPAPADVAIQNKWFGYKFFKGDQFQLGVRYPFIF